MNETNRRRDLRFENLGQVVEEATRLLNRGYVPNGSWTLGQVCGHCANWLSYPMDGFPAPGFPINLMLWIAKNTIGKNSLKKILESGMMKPGQPTMPLSVPKADEAEDRVQVERLKDTIERFQNFNDDFDDSPLFGAMDKDTLTRLNLIHMSHHFSFLQPA